MKLLLPFLLMLGAAMPPIVDPERVEAELAADADVLRSLAENGNVPTVVRPVDVRFTGSVDAVALLEKQIISRGWRVVQRVGLEDGGQALDVQRDQTTDAQAIRALTEDSLSIEADYGVHYDGWGTVATKP
jgi:regulator of RNase E activity RraB